MIGNIFKSILKNIQFFLVTWVVIIIANQLFIFNGCSAGYCILAALPHTSVIAALITFFYHEDSSENKKESRSNTIIPSISDCEKYDNTLCPNCGSAMRIRLAKRGRFAGKQFLGCIKYPECNGIINIK